VTTQKQCAPLFRQAAVDASLGSQIGEAVCEHWRGTRILTILAFCLTACLFIFAGVVEYAPAYRVPCYTDAQNGLARLSAPVDGQIIQLSATQGSRVQKGDLLAILSTDRLREGGDSKHSALAQRLRAEREIISREIEAAEKEARANQALISRRIAGLRTEQIAAEADSRSADTLLSSLRAQADQFADLIRTGYVSKLQLAQKRDEVSLQESRAAAARATLIRIRRDIDTSQAERSLVDARLNGTIEDRRRAAGELERIGVQSDSEAEQAIRAPVDGLVSAALIANGQSVEQGQLLFSVAPAHEPLVIRLLVPARAAAAVRPGMDIRFTLQAYPREKFGDFAAHIVNVSDVPALPGDVTQILPVSGAAFIAVASFSRTLRSDSGKDLPAKPGMIGEALVPVERRTVLEWLLEPILRGLNRSWERPDVSAIGGTTS